MRYPCKRLCGAAAGGREGGVVACKCVQGWLVSPVHGVPSAFPSIYLSIYLFIGTPGIFTCIPLHFFLWFYLSICSSMNLSICLSSYLCSEYLFIYVSVARPRLACLFCPWCPRTLRMYPSAFLSAYLSIYPSIYSSMYECMYVSIYLFI